MNEVMNGVHEMVMPVRFVDVRILSLLLLARLLLCEQGVECAAGGGGGGVGDGQQDGGSDNDGFPRS
jgi:hypothetical protein